MKHIKTALITIFAIVIFCVCSIFFTISYAFSSNAVSDTVNSDLVMTAKVVADYIETAVKKETSLLETIARRPDITNAVIPLEQRARLLQEELDQYDDWQYFLLSDV